VIQESDLDKQRPAPLFISVAAGRDHSIAVSADGDVYTCGSNQHGQLGLPGIENCITFSKVHSCQNVRVVSTFAGGDHSFILLNDHLKKRAPLNDIGVVIPDLDDGIVEYKEDDLLGSFARDE
jgi:alpha-tubulin suppressor-like RCC1 family protein